MAYNILHFICHDLGRELGAYGNQTVPSPHLDAFAAESVRFNNYFAASTPCSPSRGCIMTGKYAHTNGLIGLVNRGWDLPEEQTTIVDCLNDAGYHTALLGLQHERKDPSKSHYQYTWLESADAMRVAGQLAEYIESVPEPFYINAGTFEVHLPFTQDHYHFDNPEEVELPFYLPDNPDNRLERARFHGAIRYMDEAFQAILDALHRTGLDRNTIVVFTTDHGEAFPRAKSTLFDNGIGTTLLVRHPGAQPGVRDELLSNIDLMPTLLEAANVDVPPDVQGRSFLPLITGDGPYRPRDEVFSEKNFHDHYDPVRAVRTPKYKYIRSFKDVPAIALPKDIADSIASNTLRPEAGEPRAPEELYDLETDPHEEHNRIEDPGLAGIRAELSVRVDAWMRDTADPLLETIDLPYPAEQYPNGG